MASDDVPPCTGTAGFVTLIALHSTLPDIKDEAVPLEAPTSGEPAGLFRLETFAPFLEGEFLLLRGNEWVPVILAEASPVGGYRPLECEKFSLIFATGPEKPLQQGIHEFRHESLGNFELFITPVRSPDRDRCWYEASVNRETGS
jgi:hypothetical protein